MTSKIQDAVSGTHRRRLAHTTIHSCLPPHPHIHSNISSILLIKKPLGVPDSGVHQARCSEYIPPGHPVTRTHMYRNADTQRRPWTHSHGRKPPCAASPASARPGAPACYFSESQSPALGSSAPGGRCPSSQPPPPPSARCPPRNPESERSGQKSRERGVRRLDCGAEGGRSWMPRGTWERSPQDLDSSGLPGPGERETRACQGAAQLPSSLLSNRFFLPLSWGGGGGAQRPAALSSSRKS